MLTLKFDKGLIKIRELGQSQYAIILWAFYFSGALSGSLEAHHIQWVDVGIVIGVAVFGHLVA